MARIVALPDRRDILGGEEPRCCEHRHSVILGQESSSNPLVQLRPGHSTLTLSQRAFALADAITAARCLPLFFQSWWLSLKLASAHVSHEVMKARKIIDKISPTSDEWDTQVVPKALERSSPPWQASLAL